MVGPAGSEPEKHEVQAAEGRLGSEPTMPRHNAEASRAELAQAIAQQLAGLAFGSIVITVHNGRVVQLERTEKTRF